MEVLKMVAVLILMLLNSQLKAMDKLINDKLNWIYSYFHKNQNGLLEKND